MGRNRRLVVHKSPPGVCRVNQRRNACGAPGKQGSHRDVAVSMRLGIDPTDKIGGQSRIRKIGRIAVGNILHQDGRA